jgi:hypothetical protein
VRRDSKHKSEREKSEGKKRSPLTLFAYPGLYYAVLRSTVVVHEIFRRGNDGDAGICDKS